MALQMEITRSLFSFFVALAIAITWPTDCNGVSVTDYYCHGFENIFVKDRGEIFSHLKFGSLNYQVSMDCYWQINGPLGLRIAAWFTFVDLESSFDEVVVRDGFNDSSIILVVSGSKLANITSSSNVLTVHFHSYISKNMKGFRMKFVVTTDFPEFTYCSGFQNISSSTDSHEISSHSGAGTTLYRADMHCEWLITAPQETKLMAWFSDFDLQDGDTVVLYDGLSRHVIVNISHHESPAYVSSIYMTESSVLGVRFVTDGSDAGKGFRLQYKSTNTSTNMDCGALSFSNSSNTTGNIASHKEFHGFSPYSPDMYCTWSLPERIGSGHKTELSLTLSNVSLGLGDCLIISSDVPLDRNRTVARYCGWISASNVSFLVPGNVRILFYSDNSFESLGFLLKFQYQFFRYMFLNLSGQETGEIVSHSGVGVSQYFNNIRHYWQINAPIGNQIVSWLTLCSLDPSDSVILYDGITGSVIRSIRNCNTSFGSFSTRSSVLWVEFSTDDSGTALGFRLEFNTTQMYEYCFGSMSLTEHRGEIFSHAAAGVSNYQDNLDCSWKISAPLGDRLLVWFLLVDVEKCCDRLTLVDGANKGKIIAKISQNTSAGYASPIFASTSNVISVLFQSDFSLRGLGFRLAYSRSHSVSAVRKCGLISSADASNASAILTSHDAYDGWTLYSPNMSCEWNFTALPGHETELQISSLSLSSGDCLRLVGSLFVGGATSDSVFCGWTALNNLSAPFLARSTAGLEFKSDGDGFESTGFIARFHSVPVDRQFHNITAENSGEIVSHSRYSVTPYAHNLRYTWQINAPVGYGFEAWLAYCNLSSPPDAISVYDSVTSSVLARFTSTEMSSSYIQSLSNNLVVDFTTDSSGAGLGFQLKYLSTLGYKFCQGSLILTAENGSVSSHRLAGSSPYRNNMNCSWRIVAPAGENIIAWFTYVDLETCCDSVTLIDGANGSAVVATVRGTAASFDYIRRYNSESGTLTVHFQSDVSVTGLGFRLQYNSTENYCRGVKYLSGETGQIVSHRAVQSAPYANNMLCRWQINTPMGTRVRVRFVYISLESSADAVALFDGPVGSTRQLAVVHGARTVFNDRNMTVTASSNTMSVRFSTDSSGTAFGFKIEYSYYHTEMYKMYNSTTRGSPEVVGVYHPLVAILATASLLGLL